MDEWQMRALPIVAVVGLALWTPVLWGANFKIAGMIDNDVALVSEDSVELFKDKSKLTSFVWGMGNSKADKLIDGKKYDSIEEMSFVDCDKPNARGVLTRKYQFRGLKEKSPGEIIEVKVEEFMKGGDTTISMTNTERLSPAGLAIGYACALAASKTLKKPISYRDPTKPSSDAKQLICEFRTSKGESLEIDVAFDESLRMAFLQSVAYSTTVIDDRQITIEKRNAYGIQSSNRLEISRASGKAKLNDVLNGECRARGTNKF